MMSSRQLTASFGVLERSRPGNGQIGRVLLNWAEGDGLISALKATMDLNLLLCLCIINLSKLMI